MSWLLVTFFISLAGITGLISRKLIFSTNNRINQEHDFAIDVPDLDEVKKIASKNTKKLGYILLVLTIRTYLLSQDLIKKQYKVIKNKLEERRIKRMAKTGKIVMSNREPSKFLKIISDYKKKVEKIKSKIKEEEGLN